MITPVAIACSQLLKDIHISKLEIIVLVYMISKANKKTVLVKIIIDDLLTKVDMNFIVYNKRECSGLKMFFAQWKLRKEIIANSEIKIITIRQFIIIENFSAPSFF